MIGTDLVDEFVLCHGLCGVIDVIALSSEELDSIMTNVLEHQKPESVVFNRVQNLRLANVSKGSRISAASIMKVVVQR